MAALPSSSQVAPGSGSAVVSQAPTQGAPATVPSPASPSTIEVGGAVSVTVESPVVVPGPPAEPTEASVSPAAVGAPAVLPPLPDVVLVALPPRVRLLYERLVAAGSMATQDHMESTGISHRTGLRDLQQLVDLGLAERVGSRRGARYRPTSSHGPLGGVADSK